MSETTSAASERAAILTADLTACRVQVAEQIARRDALAGENERLRAIEAAVREWVRRNRVCEGAEEDGDLDGDGAMPDGTDCPTWCNEAWDAIEAALASAPAGESEVARLREELRIVSRYAARLHDAADDLIHLNTADERVRAEADRAVLFALYPGCVRHGDLSETVGDDPCAGCGEEGCEVRVWHAALKRGREAE